MNEQDYDRLYEWKILLKDDELKFEYLDSKNEIEDEIIIWR